MIKTKFALCLFAVFQSCTTMDFSSIEDSWSFDEFRQYALLRCTAYAYQNEQQFEIAKLYYAKSETMLATSPHPAHIYYDLGQQAKTTAAILNINQSGQICMDWVLSKEFNQSLIQTLSSPL